MNAMLWIDQRDHFAMEHLEEWAKQKEQECGGGVQGPYYKEAGR